LFCRNQNVYEFNFSDEEEEEENETYSYYAQSMEKDNLVADIIHDCEYESVIQVMPNNSTHTNHNHVEDFVSTPEAVLEEQDDSFASDEMLSVLASAGSESEHGDADMVEEEMQTSDIDSVHDSVPNQQGPTAPITKDLHKSGFMDSDENSGGIWLYLHHISFSRKSLLH